MDHTSSNIIYLDDVKQEHERQRLERLVELVDRHLRSQREPGHHNDNHKS